ncbi:MAG: PrgI family protein [bacterium]|nr:PrgI family protein [bacterium]
MRFQVPQFIEVEDKIFGPLSIKQFIYVVGGAGLSFLIYRLAPFNFVFKVMVAAPAVILGALLAFYKINDKPFIFAVESAIRYFFGIKLYIWKKQPKKPEKKREEEKEDVSGLYVPRLSDSRLKDLTWSLDIAENKNLGAKESMGKNNANTTK